MKQAGTGDYEGVTVESCAVCGLVFNIAAITVTRETARAGYRDFEMEKRK